MESKNLRTLDLEGNNLTQIVSNSLLKFENEEMELIIGNNKIQMLSPFAFNSFTKFKRLDLSYNQVCLKFW